MALPPPSPDSDDYFPWIFVLSVLAEVGRAVDDADRARSLVDALAGSPRLWLENDLDLPVAVHIGSSIVRAVAQLGRHAVPILLGMLRSARRDQLSLCPLLACVAVPTLVAVGEADAADEVARTIVALVVPSDAQPPRS
jgi:hypothetical protein